MSLIWVRKFGESVWGAEMQNVGEKVWGCGLGIFDLVGCNGLCQHVGLGRLVGAYRVYPRCVDFKGLERGSKLGL